MIKTVRFGRSLVRNLIKVWAWVEISKGLTKFVHVSILAPGFLHCSDKDASLSPPGARRALSQERCIFCIQGDKFPCGTDCFSSYFNSSYHMPLWDILGQLSWALTLPYLRKWVVTRLYLKLPSYRVS